MTAKDIYNRCAAAAGEVYEPREAAAAAHFLLEEVWGVSRLQLACEPEKEVVEGAPSEAEGMARGVDGTPEGTPPPLDSVLRDIAAGRPVQYIAGRAPFCGMRLAVREGVLIPRPETEELVEWVASELKGGETVLDVGTGSGAIAIALARAGARVTALDISEAALTIARENAREQGAEVDFRRCDILARDAAEVPAPGKTGETGAGAAMPQKFDIIVSNPPYIPHSERAAMHRNVVEHEPHGALFVPDADPLLFYRAIARLGAERLFFEVHFRVGRDVCDMLRQHGYGRVELRADINGRDRMVRASLER